MNCKAVRSGGGTTTLHHCETRHQGTDATLYHIVRCGERESDGSRVSGRCWRKRALYKTVSEQYNLQDNENATALVPDRTTASYVAVSNIRKSTWGAEREHVLVHDVTSPSARTLFTGVSTSSVHHLVSCYSVSKAPLAQASRATCLPLPSRSLDITSHLNPYTCWTQLVYSGLPPLPPKGPQQLARNRHRVCGDVFFHFTPSVGSAPQDR